MLQNRKAGFQVSYSVLHSVLFDSVLVHCMVFLFPFQGHNKPIMSLAFSEDKSKIFSGASDGQIYILLLSFEPRKNI